MATETRTGTGWGRLEAPTRAVTGIMTAAKVAFWVFVGAFVIQIIHFAEHYVQLHQLIWLGRAVPLGIIGEHFNFVWVHFVFNTALLIAIVVPFLLWLWRPGIWRPSRAGAGAFWFLVLFQTYHGIEHAVQMYQHIRFGNLRPPGILGHEIPNIILHFDFNLVVLVFMTAVVLLLQPRPRPFRTMDGAGEETAA